MEKTFFLKLTSAIGIDGILCKSGQIIEVTEGEAKDLLRRGKAELHEMIEEADDSAAPDLPTAPATTDKKATK